MRKNVFAKWKSFFISILSIGCNQAQKDNFFPDSGKKIALAEKTGKKNQ
jgi:hypothetical protein